MIRGALSSLLVLYLTTIALAATSYDTRAAAPSTCSASVTLQTRGSTWYDAGVPNRIKDIYIKNTGTKAITGITVRISVKTCKATREWNYNATTGVVTFFQPLAKGQTYKSAGFILAGVCSSSPTITWSSTCVVPTPTPSATPSPTSTPAPIVRSTTEPTCDMVLIIDNTIVQSRARYNMASDIKANYASYLHDVDAYFRNEFKLHINYTIFVETQPTFSNATDPAQYLADFSAALQQQKFGTDVPSSACVYHLLSGRSFSVTGLSNFDTACSTTNPPRNVAFSTDRDGLENPGSPILKMIFQMSFELGAHHASFYTRNVSNPGYTCSATNGAIQDPSKRNVVPTDHVEEAEGQDDVMDSLVTRDEMMVEASGDGGGQIRYNYIYYWGRLSDCAIKSIKARLPTLSCLWNNVPTTNLPYVTFYDDADYGGAEYTVYAYQGTGSYQCYDLSDFNDRASSYKAHGGPAGIRLFPSLDCLGDSGYYGVSDVNSFANIDNNVSSFTFGY